MAIVTAIVVSDSFGVDHNAVCSWTVLEFVSGLPEHTGWEQAEVHRVVSCIVSHSFFRYCMLVPFCGHHAQMIGDSGDGGALNPISRSKDGCLRSSY